MKFEKFRVRNLKGDESMKYDQPYYGLINALKVSNINQEEAGKIINVSRSTFNQKLNRNAGRDFKLGEAKRLAQRLNISVSDFF
ncbi:MAG: helix-turn-helix domain-containing protein [Lactobacillus sp.]|nr:helix-turn-helix domain-containing protein [Lactobacillus sp.]